jgi:predicted transcriptional regulator YdeE
MSTMSSIELVDEQEVIAVGFRIDGTWETLHRDVPAAWRTLFERRREVEDVADRAGDYVGVSLDVTDGWFKEFVGIRVDGCASPPPGMTLLSIPANRYVSCEHRGALADIFRSFEALQRHARDIGLVPTEVKLDFGYDEGMGNGPHRLFMAVEPARSPAAA